jgi:hypothetical protein
MALPDPRLSYRGEMAAACRSQTRSIAAELMAVRRRLSEIAQALPLYQRTVAIAGGDQDPSSDLAELRRAIERVVSESLTAAITDLLAASND